jgi:ABC-type amino acid transport system permease subunit
MSAQGTQETLVRSVVGALIGLVIGLLLVVGTASYYANSIAALAGVVAVSVILCAVMAWRFGDRFIQSVHKWIQWLQ